MNTLPAGEYWIGDLCYVLDSVWTEVCDKFFADENGIITLDDGRRCIMSFTAYGDGTYEDTYGREYGVDAGVLGAILLADTDTGNGASGGHVTWMETPFSCVNDKGVISFGRVVIDTTNGY